MTTIQNTTPRIGKKRDAANLLCCCTRTIDSLMQQGLPHIKINSRNIRFDLDQVREWASRKYSTARIGPATRKD